jgi:hypothetical protein
MHKIEIAVPTVTHGNIIRSYAKLSWITMNSKKAFKNVWFNTIEEAEEEYKNRVEYLKKYDEEHGTKSADIVDHRITEKK